MMRITAFKRQQAQSSRRSRRNRSGRLDLHLEATDGVIASRTKHNRPSSVLQRNHLDLPLAQQQIKFQSLK